MVCDFIPTGTDTGVHRSARVFVMCVFVCVFVYDVCVYDVLGIHELCLEKI